MIVEFSTEVEIWQEEGPEEDYLNNVPYSYRGATKGRITNVTAAVSSQAQKDRSYGGESLVKEMPGILLGAVLYVVVVGYTSGDTFGRDGGHTCVLDAFTDPDKAKALMDAVAETKQDSDYRLTHNGVEYYCPWVGYFEHMEEVNVWEVTVRDRHTYSRFEDGVVKGFKRGR